MNYWEVKNKVKFPKNFQPDYQWNVDFAHQVMALAAANDLHVYFMPIRIDLERYFQQIRFS
jgi:methylenetetrahydrofolate reductase (NADPH)